MVNSKISNVFCIIVESNSQKTFSLLFLVYTNMAAVRHGKTLHNRPAVSGNDLSPNCFLWDDSKEEQYHFQVNEGNPFLNRKTKVPVNTSTYSYLPVEDSHRHFKLQRFITKKTGQFYNYL